MVLEPGGCPGGWALLSPEDAHSTPSPCEPRRVLRARGAAAGGVVALPWHRPLAAAGPWVRDKGCGAAPAPGAEPAPEVSAV